MSILELLVIVAFLFLSSLNVLTVVAFPRHYCPFLRRLVAHERGNTANPLAAISTTTMTSDNGGYSHGGVDANTNTNAASSSKKLFQFYTMSNGMCPYAARTWMTLLELNLPFDTVDVSPMKREEWYLKINPNNKVPALQNTKDGTVVYESAICNEYLSDYARQIDTTTTANTTTLDGTTTKNSQNDHGTAAAAVVCWNLMPISAADRVALRLLNHHVDTTLNPAVFTLLMNKDPDKDFIMKETLEDALQTLQDSLLTRGGPYLMGHDFSLADIHVLPFILRMMITMKHYKEYEVLSPSTSSSSNRNFQPLLDWFQLCSKRPSYIQAVSKSQDEIVEVYDKFMDMNYAFGGLNKNKI